MSSVALLNPQLEALAETNFHAAQQAYSKFLSRLTLHGLLKSLNEFHIVGRGIFVVGDLVEKLLDERLERIRCYYTDKTLLALARLVIEVDCKGYQSIFEGIDLEFDRDGIRYIVSIKSGPNWGNSGQIKKMQDNFTKAQKVLRTGNSKLHVQAVNGCCYGKDGNPDKGTYRKLCGQRFWTFISGDESLYTKLVEPIGHRAKEKNDHFQKQYAKVINLFAQEFMQDFCNDGEIEWVKLVEFNSAGLGE